MKIYLSRRSIPELRDLPKPLQRRIYMDHTSRAARHWEVWVAGVLYLVIGTAGLIFISGLARDLPLWQDLVLMLPARIAYFSVASIAFLQVLIRKARPYYREALEELDRHWTPPTADSADQVS